MIASFLKQFSEAAACTSVHLPFHFTPDVAAVRQGSFGKVIELFRVIGRLFRIRAAGPIDLLLFPVGGPQTVPMIRDLLLLPWVLLFARRFVLHFHAGGIAEQLGRGNLLARLLAVFYSRAFAAIVMTEFNRHDPEAMGTRRVLVIPHRIPDEFDPALVYRANGGTIVRLLYLGHLSAEKGTPQLIHAFAALRRRHPGLKLELELAGECLPSFSLSQLQQEIDALQLTGSVHLPGLLRARDKARAFGRAHLFVFPSVADYESFGLVLIEAMAWKLPILATRWRGNADVLTENFGGILFPVGADLSENIRVALAAALQERGQWRQWGEANRAIFERYYMQEHGEPWLPKTLLSLVTQTETEAQRR